MSNDIEKLENEIKVLYLDIADVEVKVASNTLAEFFAVGIKIMQEMNEDPLISPKETSQNLINENLTIN